MQPSLNPKDWQSLEIDSCRFDTVKLESSTCPRDYLDFANQDLDSQDSARSRANATSNAKRALHFQVDLLAEAFGFQKTNAKKNFPNKLEFCGRCGIVAPRILKKLNALRNTLEHEYYIPNRAEAEDFVDVVCLFLAATDQILLKFPSEFSLFSKDKDQNWKLCGARLDPGSGIIVLEFWETIGRAEFQAAAESEKKGFEEYENFGDSYVVLGTEYRRVQNISVSVSEGEPYFEWLTFLREASPF